MGTPSEIDFLRVELAKRDALNEVIAEQAKIIAALTTKVGALTTKVEALMLKQAELTTRSNPIRRRPGIVAPVAEPSYRNDNSERFMTRASTPVRRESRR